MTPEMESFSRRSNSRALLIASSFLGVQIKFGERGGGLSGVPIASLTLESTGNG
jgi:hypothetical protein